MKNHFIACILIFCTMPAFSQKSWTANPDLVKKASKNRSNVNYDEANVPDYLLPDLLVNSEGTPIKTKDNWTTARKKHLKWFEENVFGKVPDTPYNIDFKLVKSGPSDTLTGVMHKVVDIQLTTPGHLLTLRAHLLKAADSPNGQPAALLINHRGNSMDDPIVQIRTGFFPAKLITDKGFVAVIFQAADVDPDSNNPDTEFKNGIHPILDQKRDSSSWGTLAAWAWGASRVLDYLQNDEWVDPGKVAVVGHSRGGKTALWAGANDDRFAAVYSNCSGAGGAALSRRKLGERLSHLNTRFPHWFCLNYHQFNEREEDQPVDAHTLLALSAPRPLYVVSADEDLWADPRGEFLSLQAASKVYALFGYQDLENQEMPALNQPIHHRVGYHIRTGVHNLTPYDWEQFLDFLVLNL